MAYLGSLLISQMVLSVTNIFLIKAKEWAFHSKNICTNKTYPACSGHKIVLCPWYLVSRLLPCLDSETVWNEQLRLKLKFPKITREINLSLCAIDFKGLAHPYTLL